MKCLFCHARSQFLYCFMQRNLGSQTAECVHLVYLILCASYIERFTLLTPCLIFALTYLSCLSPAHAFNCDVYSSTSKNIILNFFCSDPSSRQCNSVMGNLYRRMALHYFPPLRLSRHSYIDILVSVKKYMKMTILWVTASCIVMKVYHVSEVLHHQAMTLTFT
jgi:hypothetical protein